MANEKKIQEVRLRGVRLSFPQIFDPKAMEQGKEPTYSANFLLHKVRDKEQISLVEKAIKEVMREKQWEKPKALKLCLKQADEKEYDGYTSDFLYISASSQNPFPIIDKHFRPLTKKDGKPYAGCYVNVNLNIRPFEHQMNKGVSAYIRAIQFDRDGERFGGGTVDLEKEFGDVDPGEEFNEGESLV